MNNIYSKIIIYRQYREHGKRAVALFALLCIFITSLCGCEMKNSEPIQKSGFYFDTFITISIYDKKDTEILEKCFEKCSQYENMFSRTIEGSEISNINNAGGEAVNVSDETFELIEKGIYYGELSDGLFDITIAPVSELWDFHEDSERRIPDRDVLEEALTHVSYKNIVLNKDDKSVQITDKEAKIDVGGIAKGYIADKLKEYLVSQGVKSALINLGGNIITVGRKPDNSPFHIGIKKPFSDSEILDEVDLNDRAVSSSGVYERYFYEGDKLYHHILLPSSGYPVESDLFGASVICDSSIDADALSTICILVGSKKAEELINDIEDADVIFAYSDK